MSNNVLTAKPNQSVAPAGVFAGWHPLKEGWLDDLAPEIREIVRYAQHCLGALARTDGELAEAMAQIKAWRKAHPELIDEVFAPELVFDENLGTQLEPGHFARFLLDRESTLRYKPYEYAALTLLQEANGLADLYIVGKRDTISPVAQHLTLKIARLHAATVLLRRLNDNGREDSIPAIMTALLSHGNTTA
jgi:hypothetical protein